ncbi:MAG: diguanylate cyclase domain-containing protein [Ectothiorhodospira sp.]
MGWITLSLGVANFREGDSRKHLLRRADDALYRAKENGRNRIECA